MANPVHVDENGLTVLYEAPNATIDVVFVHGFTGHPRRTWTLRRAKRTSQHADNDQAIEPERRSKIPRLLSLGRGHSTHSFATTPNPISDSLRALGTSGASTTMSMVTDGHAGRASDIFWPAELLPSTLPDARIMTYGYDTRIKHWSQGQGSKNTVYDHAWDLLCCLEALRRDSTKMNRPLLFVVHSLGGIVVKETLRRSRTCSSVKPHLHNIFASTVGAVFFGTPHSGADPRNAFHHIISSFAQATGFRPNKQIVDTLMPNSERLTELRDEFSIMCHERNWKIHSFQESHGLTALFGTKVVDDASSCLNDPTIETKQHIANDHKDMCRFSGLDDPEYRKVAAAITGIVGNIQKSPELDCPSSEQPLGRKATPAMTLSQESELPNNGPSAQHQNHGHHSSSQPDNESKEIRQSDSCAINSTMRQALLRGLYFDKIDERLTGLTAAYGTTCRWFFTMPEYKSWQDIQKLPEQGGFLWIKGNPGTGKSTLMKLLFERAKQDARGDPMQLHVSFFFNARGNFEERSTLGLYRSLLHQLFEKAPDLAESLEWMTVDGARGIERTGWHEEALKQTLTHTIRKLESRSLTIFVDALDECDQTQAKAMIEAFEELCERAQDLHCNLRICFSSRHYPTILIKTGFEVVLEAEDGHMEDIRTFVKSKLRLGKSKQAESLRAAILERSSGIFLWVVLVIDILNSEYPQGSISAIKARLKEIPQKLNELFEMILRRDGDNLDQLRICFNLVLFARRPLKPQELYFAVQLGLDKNAPTEWDQDDIEPEKMKTIVRIYSKGLAEVTRNKASEVQFIHESVRDFLLGKYGGQWSQASENFEAHGHEILRDCCLAQLHSPMKDIPDPLPKASQAEKLRETIKLKFPFLEYAILGVLHHADEAHRYGKGQAAFLSCFPLADWVTLRNAFERYDVRRYTESVSLPYVLAEKNFANLLMVHPSTNKSCFEIEDERYGAPVFAALASGSDDAVCAMQSLLLQQNYVESKVPHVVHVCREILTQGKNWSHLPRDFHSPHQDNMLLSVFDMNDDHLLALFLLQQSAIGVNSKAFCDAALLLSAQNGFYTSVGGLLGEGADIQSKNSDGRSALCMAAVTGHVAITQLLLDRGADIETRDQSRRTPLSWAATTSHVAITQLLLDRGAHIETRDQSSRTPLSWAATTSYVAITQLLLDRGADIETRDQSSRTPLWWATSTRNVAITQLLLDRGANIETRNQSSRTPLSWAATTSDIAMAQLLLDRGANIETMNQSSRTPLSWAASTGRVAMTQLLLDRGADIETRDRIGKTPLSWAAESGQEAMVRLLLERGAHPETRDRNGETPLSIANLYGREAIARLLCERCAAIYSCERSKPGDVGGKI